jgi:hypothetical protein
MMDLGNIVDLHAHNHELHAHGPRFGRWATLLLTEWIDVLYGEGTGDTLNLGARLAAITEGRRTGRSDPGVIVCYGPRIDQLVRELSEQLPPYHSAGKHYVAR